MKKIAVAITGASGAIYAKILLEKLQQISDQYERVDIVVTDNAKSIWLSEIGEKFILKSNFREFDNKDFSAPFASGSAGYDALLIVPCSMGMLGRIANGVSNDLISRSADVMLKERKKIICVVRETPYNLIHIKNMEIITLAGGIICPATPSFYHLPKTIEDLVSSVVDRVLDLAGFDIKTYRWGNENEK